MGTREAVFALALGAAVLSTGTALAAGGKAARKRVQTIELTRPSGARDANAAGTVNVTHGANGDRTTIDLSHLDARRRFEIRDAATGARLGTVRTNRRGHATFDLTRSLTKSASVNGANAGDVSNVEIVDPATGDTVLTGDVTPDPVVPQFGYAGYADDAGDSGDVSLTSDPDDGIEAFSLTFFPASDPSATSWSYYELNLDTSNGDSLPLGVASVTELAGRRFEIVAADGTVVIDDKLPELQSADCPFGLGDDDWWGDWGGDWNGGWDWSGDFGGDWSGDFSWPDDPSGYDSDDGANPARHGRGAHAKRAKGRKADGAGGYSLLVADADGVLQGAGELKQETFDVPADCPIFDPSGYGDFGDFGDGADLIGFLFFPARHHRR